MGITRHNEEFSKNPNNDEAFQAIFESLQDQVKAHIQANFPVELKSTRQVTDFLNATFLKYREKVASGSGPWVEFDTKRLLGYLRQIARKELSAAKRGEKSAGRDPGNIVPTPAEKLASTKAASVEDVLCQREEARLLCLELLNEEKERNKLINLMRFGLGLSARDIEEVLRHANRGERIVSDNTILRVITNTSARLANLGRDLSDD